MKTIFFLRSAKYDYTIPGLDLYDSFNAVIKKEVIPEIIESKDDYLSRLSKRIRSIPTVFSSPDQRCQKTAAFITKKYRELHFLAEIEYVMEDFITKEAFFSGGKPQVDLARKLFVQALIQNQLRESYTSVLSRIQELQLFLVMSRRSEVVCISHGFLLKVIEAYFRDPRIVVDPRLLLQYFDGTEQTYAFGKGFRVDFEHDLVKTSYF